MYMVFSSYLLLQFTKAVEAKQVAQQEAERARFVVMKADQVRCCLENRVLLSVNLAECHSCLSFG